MAEKREAHYTYKGEKGGDHGYSRRRLEDVPRRRNRRDGSLHEQDQQGVPPIIMRRPRDQDLFEEKSPRRYHAIASNREDEDAVATMEWYCKCGDASENRIKDLKIGFGMDYMPCGTFEANAVFFSIGVLTYNLYLGFRGAALGCGWERSQVQTVRWRLFQTAGKIVRHGRRVFLKISAAMLKVFAAIRERCARVMREKGAVPETS